MFFDCAPFVFRLSCAPFRFSRALFRLSRALRQRISALFHSTPPHFLSLPACAAHNSLRHRRASPLFSPAHRVRALHFHKKRIHRQYDEQCCRWILFSRRGLSWHRRRLIYIMVWRERGNRPYRRHFSPRTVPAVPYLKGTPPWNTRKHPSLFFAKRGRRKSMHSVIRTPQLLLRTAPASFHTAQPIQSIAPFLCHLHPDCPTKPKKKHTT